MERIRTLSRPHARRRVRSGKVHDCNAAQQALSKVWLDSFHGKGVPYVATRERPWIIMTIYVLTFTPSIKCALDKENGFRTAKIIAISIKCNYLDMQKRPCSGEISTYLFLCPPICKMFTFDKLTQEWHEAEVKLGEHKYFLSYFAHLLHLPGKQL